MNEFLPVRQTPRSKLPRSVAILTTISATVSIIFAIVFWMADFFFFFRTDDKFTFLGWDLSIAIADFFGGGYYLIFLGAIWSGIYYYLRSEGWLLRWRARFLAFGASVILGLAFWRVGAFLFPASLTAYVFDEIIGLALPESSARMFDWIVLNATSIGLVYYLRYKGLLWRQWALVLAMGTSITISIAFWRPNLPLSYLAPIDLYELGVEIPVATRWIFDRNGYCLILLGAIWSGIFCRWTYMGWLSRRRALLLTSATAILTLAYGVYVLLAFFAPFLIPMHVM